MNNALPLELLQPLDSSHPSSLPVPLSGPEQRLTITPDPGVGDDALLPPSQLLIGKDGAIRSIWPVHLAGWQALGWQLLSSTSGSDDPAPLEAGDSAPAAELEPAPTDSGSAAGEALLASDATDFQAMTKAQIVEFCSSAYGVELDGSQTKAELVQQATALNAQELGDALL